MGGVVDQESRDPRGCRRSRDAEGAGTAHEVASACYLTDAQRRALLLDFDRVLELDLGLARPGDAPVPEGAADLLDRRAVTRAARNFAASDALRMSLPRSASRSATRRTAR